MTDTPVDDPAEQMNPYAKMSTPEIVGLLQALDGPPPLARPEPMQKKVWFARAADIAPRRLNWLWPGRIPLGKVTLVAGEGGIGKSTLLFDIAARVSRGTLWPDGTSMPQGSVAILSADDDFADTITPRLIAARAEMARIGTIGRLEDANKPRRFRLPDDLPDLEELIDTQGDAQLVIIDPLTAYLGKKGLTRDADVLAILDLLNALAARRGVAIVCSYHFGKGSAKRANHRFRGSIALTIHARSALVVELRPDGGGQRVLAPSKQNLGPPAPTLAFALEPATVPAADGPIETIRIAWNDAPVPWTADEVASEGQGGRARSEAMAFLSDALAQGPLPAGEVLKRAREAGINRKPLHAAREKLGIRTVKAGFDAAWVWVPPEKDA